MTLKEFETFIDSEMKRCKEIMASKNADYSSGEDKLANFKLAGTIDKLKPELALWGMDLKHRTSILQGLMDWQDKKKRPLMWWQEKIRDHINYMYLLLALITENLGGPEE